MKTGSTKLGLPILDPFKADQLAINVNEDVIKCVPFQFLLQFLITQYLRYEQKSHKTKYCFIAFFHRLFSFEFILLIYDNKINL